MRLFGGVDLILPEDARAGRVDARPEYRAGAHHVRVRKDFRVAGLGIAGGGHAVGQVGQVGPHVGAVQFVARPQVGVGVHEARHDGAPGHVDHHGAIGNHHRPGRTHRFDPVVAHHDVGVFDHLVAVHGDRAPAPEHGQAFGNVAGRVDEHPELRGAVLVLFVPRLVLGLLFLSFPRLSLLLCFLRLLRSRHAVLEGLGGIQVVDEVRVAQRPVHRAPVAAPGRKLAADVGQLTSREGRVVRI